MASGLLVSVDPKDRTPIYAQLDRGLRAAIATGRLQVGDQLPTVRQLAVDLSINANTVAGSAPSSNEPA
jgi:GntR family transcriptional regulator